MDENDKWYLLTSLRWRNKTKLVMVQSETKTIKNKIVRHVAVSAVAIIVITLSTRQHTNL